MRWLRSSLTRRARTVVGTEERWTRVFGVGGQAWAAVAGAVPEVAGSTRVGGGGFAENAGVSRRARGAPFSSGLPVCAPAGAARRTLTLRLV